MTSWDDVHIKIAHKHKQCIDLVVVLFNHEGISLTELLVTDLPATGFHILDLDVRFSKTSKWSKPILLSCGPYVDEISCCLVPLIRLHRY
jgi:hypothetical protein